MATTTEKPVVDALKPLGTVAEQFVATSRKAGLAYLDTYEKAVGQAIDAQTKLADASGQDWLKSLVQTQTTYTREVTEAWTAPARKLLA